MRVVAEVFMATLGSCDAILDTLTEVLFSLLFDRFRPKKLDCRKSLFHMDSSVC